MFEAVAGRPFCQVLPTVVVQGQHVIQHAPLAIKLMHEHNVFQGTSRVRCKECFPCIQLRGWDGLLGEGRGGERGE